MRDFSEIKKLFGIKEKCGFSKESVDKAIGRFGALPKVLVDYYRELGKVPGLNDSQDRFLSPDGIKEFEEYIGFYEENQYCCYWCIAKRDLNMDNPPVYCITPDCKDEVIEESSSLYDFLCTMAHMQALWTLNCGCEEFQEIDEESVKAIRKKYKKKNVASFKSWMNMEFYGNNDDEVIVLIQDDDGEYSVCYAANDEDNFEEMDEFFENELD